MAEPERMKEAWIESRAQDYDVSALVDVSGDETMVRLCWEAGYSLGHQGGFLDGMDALAQGR